MSIKTVPQSDEIITVCGGLSWGFVEKEVTEEETEEETEEATKIR